MATAHSKFSASTLHLSNCKTQFRSYLSLTHRSPSMYRICPWWKNHLIFEEGECVHVCFSSKTVLKKSMAVQRIRLHTPIAILWRFTLRCNEMLSIHTKNYSQAIHLRFNHEFIVHNSVNWNQRVSFEISSHSPQIVSYFCFYPVNNLWCIAYQLCV